MKQVKHTNINIVTLWNPFQERISHPGKCFPFNNLHGNIIFRTEKLLNEPSIFPKI